MRPGHHGLEQLGGLGLLTRAGERLREQGQRLPFPESEPVPAGRLGGGFEQRPCARGITECQPKPPLRDVEGDDAAVPAARPAVLDHSLRLLEAIGRDERLGRDRERLGVARERPRRRDRPRLLDRLVDATDLEQRPDPCRRVVDDVL